MEYASKEVLDEMLKEICKTIMKYKEADEISAGLAVELIKAIKRNLHYHELESKIDYESVE